MKISYNWLKNYIDIKLPSEEVSKLLTDCGLEVESLEKFETIKGGLKGVVIGEVLDKIKHPNADKLCITKVNVGGAESLQIVCGAPNVAIGQKVLVALAGSTLFPFTGESFEIKKSKIRGEVSDGMICAEDELGLGTNHEGVMVLDKDAKVGTFAADYLSGKDGYLKIVEDQIFEIGLTPNRSDAASHIGVARDLSAVLNNNGTNAGHTSVKLPSIENFSIDSDIFKIETVVENTTDCIRYSGICISGVQVKESPEWLKNNLKSIGLKPINNVVDCTNYVLFESGQPLHAFDADKITGKKIVVRNLPPKTRFITLDGIERELDGNELMICDAEKGMCMAGIFGGNNSGVSVQTKNIFLESACFNPVAIRKSSKRHGLKTDASFRFERGTDPDSTLYVLKRAAMLIKEICGGTISGNIIDIYPNPVQPATVAFSLKSATRLMGMKIETSVIKNILKDLGIKITSESEDHMQLSIPNYKVDVKREADVVEEIMRIYGYNRVPLPAKMNMPLPLPDKDVKEKVQNILSQFLISNGFNEMLSNSLTRESYIELLNKKEEVVKILNPLSSDLGIMRQTMLFSGLEAIQYNSNRKNSDLRFFEFGKTYQKTKTGKKDNPEYIESNQLSLFISGNRHHESWIKQQPNGYSIYYLKSLISNLLMHCGMDDKNSVHHAVENDLFEFSIGVSVADKIIVFYGKLKSSLLKHFDINIPVFYANIYTTELISNSQNTQHIVNEVTKYPEVRRDLSMVVNKDVVYADIEKVAFETERKILQSVNLFDVYTGDKIEAGKISLAISFTLRDDEKTLEEKQIDSAMNRLMMAFESKLNAQIRK